MNLYLEENSYKIIVGAGTDPYLINNISSGILDCVIRVCKNIAYDAITSHKNFKNLEDGIYFGPNGLETISLKDKPRIQNIINLINLRTPAFKQLLELYNQASLPNLYGFGPMDPVVIKHTLSDNVAISEYATVMNLDECFAKSELNMIVESIWDDRFRIFTICNMWKERINQCYTREDIDKLYGPMKNSFNGVGISVNV